MMLVAPNKIIGFEIKSDYDSTNRLQKQMEDYYGAFNSVYLVCGEKFNKQVFASLKKGIGILMLDKDKIKIVRKATEREYPQKNKIINFLWKNDLPYTSQRTQKGVDELKRILLKEKSKDELLRIVINALEKRYYSRYESFMKARGEKTCVQDIDILTIQDDYLH